MSRTKARIETQRALPDGFFLIDAARPAAYFVRPGAHVFMDAKQSSPLTRMFVPVDPDDPCRQWLAMAAAIRAGRSRDVALPARWTASRRGARPPNVYRIAERPAPRFTAGSTARADFRCRSRPRTAR